MKKAYVFLADGFEDIEAVVPIDILRRAGIAVTVVAVKGHEAVSSHALRVFCDASFADIAGEALPDLVVLPGGSQGSRNLASSAEVEALVRRMFSKNRLVGAICAAPAVALGGWGLLTGRSYTCFPGTGDDLDVKPLGKRVVENGNLVTAQAAGVAEEFALALVRNVCGAPAAEKVLSEIIGR